MYLLRLSLCVHTQVESLQTTILVCTTDTKTYTTELTELKRTFQSLEISRTSLLAEVCQGHTQKHTFTGLSGSSYHIVTGFWLLCNGHMFS